MCVREAPQQSPRFFITDCHSVAVMVVTIPEWAGQKHWLMVQLVAQAGSIPDHGGLGL